MHAKPWLTHVLQKPQSPSLQRSQRQKHSLAQARQRAQKLPLSSRRAGSSVVNVRRPSAPPGMCFGMPYRFEVSMCGGSIAAAGSPPLARARSHFLNAAYPNPNQCRHPLPAR